MNDGDRVTGVPFNKRTRANFPTVTGYLEDVSYDGPEGPVKDQMILCDGVSVDVQDGSLRPADRREKDTVFK
jgi:hypothetical protein